MGGGGSSDNAADEAAHKQAAIAQQLFDQTDPLRAGLIDRSEQYLAGGIESSPQFSAFKASAEPQYANARQSIIESTANGGALTAALAQLDASKARDMTVARGAIDESELSRALTLGTGTVGTSVNGLGTSAAIQAQRAEADAQREGSIYGAIGAGLGGFFGGK